MPRPIATERSRINLFRSCQREDRHGISTDSVVSYFAFPNGCRVPLVVLLRLRPPIHCFVQPLGRQPFHRSSSRAAGTHLANNRSDRHLDRMCEDFGVKRAAVGMSTSRTVTILDVDRWFARADSISGGFSRYPPGGQTEIMSARCPELGKYCSWSAYWWDPL